MSNLELIPNWLIVTYVFLFGLCMGSFLNVVILRGLSGEDFVMQRSKCPKCGNQLKWYMNIPLLSYIFLRGRCAFCKTKISIQYPIIELLTALLFTYVYFTYGFSIKSLFLVIIIATLIVLAMTDILETVILTNHAIFLTLTGIIYCALNLSEIGLKESLISAFAGFLIFEIISRLGYLFAGMRIFGEGDSYIASGIGAVFGFKGLIVVIILSFMLQSIFALPLITLNSFKDGKKKLGISYILVSISIVYIILTNILNLTSNNYYTVSVFIMAGILLYCLKNVISEIHSKKVLFEKNEEKRTENEDEEFEKGKNIFLLMPFGPALIVSSIICIFYLSEIKTLIKHFLY